MLERVDHARFALVGGAALAARTGQILISTILGIGSGALSYDNISGTTADWLLKFNSENLELHNVCFLSFLRKLKRHF